jgi:hypothetical protein
VAPFPYFLTFFLELQIQLPVKMHSFITHVVVVSTQIAPAALLVGYFAVDAAEYMMHMQIDRCTAHIAAAVVAD